jgi:hypothetical protein
MRFTLENQQLQDLNIDVERAFLSFFLSKRSVELHLKVLSSYCLVRKLLDEGIAFVSRMRHLPA